MQSNVRTRQVSVVATLCAAAAFTLCAAGPTQAGLFGSKKPKPAPAVVYTPPPVTLPSRVVQAAAAYEDYVDKAAAITADFPDGATVSSKVRTGAAYEAQQMQRGAAAYGAIVALQEPAFVAAVRAYSADAATRTLIVGELMKDPAYVLGIKGAEGAASAVANALDRQGSRVRSAGERVKQSAYDVQKMAWSKAPVIDRDGRLAEAKSLSTSPRQGSPEVAARLQLASTGQAPMPLIGGTPLATTDVAASIAAPLPPPYTPLVVRSLAGAALAVLGEGAESNSDNIWAVLAEPNQGMCYNMAKLNLYQCLSVAKPYYEDVFCLGQHILMDTGACIIKGAGVQKVAPLVFVERASAVPYGAPAPKKTAGKKSGGAKKAPVKKAAAKT